MNYYAENPKITLRVSIGEPNETLDLSAAFISGFSDFISGFQLPDNLSGS